MTNVDVMLDLETWGTTPGCDIRSIGACVFSTDTGLVHDGSLGTIVPFYIATHNPRGYFVQGGSFKETGNLKHQLRYNLRRDHSTEKWWSEQSPEAQGAFADPVLLDIALSRFSVWLADMSPDVTALRIWSHGAAFDPPILAAAYETVGLPLPWHYRAPRDTRTAFDMAGIDDHSAWLGGFASADDVAHHALSDAIVQARAVCAAWGRVQRWRDCSDMIDDAAADAHAEWM